MLVLFPTPFQLALLQHFFPTEGRPMGDHISSFQAGSTGSSIFSKLLGLCREGILIKKLKDTLYSAFVTIWELRSF